ncbi:MAG: hypothetical protein R3F20_15390 [Planctomycetota bacterium]
MGETIALALEGYLLIGAPVALLFAILAPRRLGLAAAPGFRILVLPSAALLWPWALLLLARGKGR